MVALTHVVPQMDVIYYTAIGSCSVCGIHWALETNFYRKRRDDHKVFYCPNGHTQYFFGETEAEKLKKQLEEQRQRTLREEARAMRNYEAMERQKRSASAYKGKLTRVKNRVKNGVCPCCNRTFVNLSRHMAGQHPGFAAEN